MSIGEDQKFSLDVTMASKVDNKNMRSPLHDIILWVCRLRRLNLTEILKISDDLSRPDTITMK
jgi:hypothetical protein